MRFFRMFSKGVDQLNGGLGAVINWLTLIMILVGAYNALARYLTRYLGVALSSNALYELQWYLFSMVFLMGAAYGLLRDAHVRVDVLYSRFEEKGRAVIDMAGTLLFLLPFSILMFWVSIPAVRASWSIREVSPDPGGLPRYPIKTLILVSFGLLILQGLSQLVKQIDVIRGVAPSEFEPRGEDEPDVRHGEGL